MNFFFSICVLRGYQPNQTKPNRTTRYTYLRKKLSPLYWNGGYDVQNGVRVDEKDAFGKANNQIT